MKYHFKLTLLGLTLFTFAFTLGIPAVKLAQFAVTPQDPSKTEGVYIQVSKGQNPNELTKLLSSLGVISQNKDFLLVGKILRRWKNIKAGEYKVSASLSPLELFSILTSGISAGHPITVREGENIYEIAEDLERNRLTTKAQFIKICKDPLFITSFEAFKANPPPTLEGYFFPDTYFFNRTQSEMDMAKEMVQHFFHYWGKPQNDRTQQLGMSRHELVTLASIIEKETGAAEERPLISAVFHNRLKKKMRLQSDPTTIYGIWERYTGNIRRSDLNAKNDYNTYSVPGLPIGPIANPGKEAIQAALYPVESPFYYFVSHNDGTHEFSRTFEEHNRAVQKFQVNTKAREGKSWRKHLKTTNTSQRSN